MKTAAIYTRVSSDRQKEDHTIESQVVTLKEHASQRELIVPEEWVFKDEGCSGAVLVRPGLERLRDLASEGQIETVLVYSPDRLSRKYAYQVLLIEEFARHGVEVEFLNSPKAHTPEEHLLVQFQGMIAEYERAQIAERTRRGKRHRAKEGSVNVLSGAPYGYRYVKKTETTAAFYEVIEAEAAVVREVYRRYTEETQSIGAIVRWLNETGVPTRKGISPWERTTVWAMLRNPAYRGMACFGKTELAPRQKVTRALRQRGGYSPRASANRERPKTEWLEIPVPALVSEDAFALAQEQLEKNRRCATKRTIEPSLLQSMLACQDCGYAYYRTSTRSTSRKIYYYRCLGSDDWRYPEGRRCQNRPIRQDYLDETVWDHVVHLLEDPSLIRAEIDRRVQAMSEMLPTKRRQETIAKELTRVRNSMVKLLDAYQHSVLTLEELRQRLPSLRKREETLKAEAHSLQSTAVDQTVYLRLAETVEDFLARIRSASSTLSVPDRQKILRLVVKEILVNHDTITIRHSIPITPKMPAPTSSGGEITPSYLLRKWSRNSTPRK
jgi:site-specific DNA recombinase